MARHRDQVVPPLRAAESAAPRTDSAESGVLVPVGLDADTDVILDGYHRVRICHELGIPDDPRVFRRFASDGDHLGHIFGLNAARLQQVGEAWGLAFCLLKRRERREITQAQAAA